MSNGGVTPEERASLPNKNKHEKRRRSHDDDKVDSPDHIKEPSQRKQRVIEGEQNTFPDGSGGDETLTHHVLPSVNIYSALRVLKSKEVSPDDYVQPIERSMFAVEAASNMKNLLKARHEALLAQRLAAQNAFADENGLSNSSSEAGGKADGTIATLLSDDVSTVDTGSTTGTTRRSQRNSVSATAFDSSGGAEESSTSYVSCYRAPQIVTTPWFKFLFHKQAGSEAYFRTRAQHRNVRAKLEWDSSAKQEFPPSSKVEELLSNLSFFERLHEEVMAFLTWAELTHWEEQKRLEILARIELVATTLWPTSRVIPFGSFYTGLSLPHGDIDICITNVPDYNSRPADLILELSRALRKCRFARNLVAITRARIPIVKFIDDSSNIQVDISVNQPSAPETSDLVRDKLAELPILRPLIMIVKKLLDQLDLNETYQGGIGSYMLFTMCLAQIQAEIRAKGLKFLRETNLGYLVYGFLERYTGFNYYFKGIDVRNEGCFFDKREMTNDRDCPQPLLCIKSPLEPGTDVGKNSYKFPEVIDRFKWRLDRLDSILEVELELEKSQDFKRLRELRTASVLATVIRPDDKLFSTREVSNHHPDQKKFSIFCSRSIPKLSHVLYMSIRDEMEGVIGKLVRSRSDSLDLNRALNGSAMHRSHSLFASMQHRSQFSPHSSTRYEEENYRNHRHIKNNKREVQEDYRRKVVVIEDETTNASNSRGPSNNNRNLLEVEQNAANTIIRNDRQLRGRKTNNSAVNQRHVGPKTNKDNVSDDDIQIISAPPSPPRGLPPDLPVRNKNSRKKHENFVNYLRKPQAIHTVERWS